MDLDEWFVICFAKVTPPICLGAKLALPFVWAIYYLLLVISNYYYYFY